MRYCYLILVLLFSDFLIAGNVNEVKKSVEDANYCAVKSDCVVVGAVCPIGCNIVVNQSKAASIKELLAGFESQCEYKCWHSREVECLNSKCVVINPYNKPLKSDAEKRAL